MIQQYFCLHFCTRALLPKLQFLKSQPAWNLKITYRVITLGLVWNDIMPNFFWLISIQEELTIMRHFSMCFIIVLIFFYSLTRKQMIGKMTPRISHRWVGSVYDDFLLISKCFIWWFNVYFFIMNIDFFSYAIFFINSETIIPDDSTEM